MVQSSDFSYRRYRDIESKLIGQLFRYGAEVFGPTSIHEAWDEFHCSSDLGAGYDSESPINQIFGPFFLFNWEIDPTNTECDETLYGKTVAESFLELHRPNLSKEEIEILEAANRRTFAFYEIRDVEPGRGFVLRNALTGIEYEVVEHLGSKNVQRGCVIFGAIFEVNGHHQTLAISPYLLPPLSIQPLIDVRKDLQKLFKTKSLTDAQISEFDIELREVFFNLLEPVLNPQKPKLCNTDGDPLVPQILHFKIDSPDSAFALLKSLAGGILTDEELRSDAKLKDGEIYEAEIPWFKKTKAKGNSESNTVLGTVKITGNKLTVSVNSNKRAKTIKKKIETALGLQAIFVTKVIENIEMERRSERAPSESSSLPIEQLSPELIDAAKKMASQHWAKWFNDKIPALNGMTPKQASKTKEGRELLEVLLNSYEQRSGQPMNAATNLFQPDIQGLRAKLGLD